MGLCAMLAGTWLAPPRARWLRTSAPRCMPEGPEVRVHSEALHARYAGQTLTWAEVVSGRYLASPPAGWEALLAALPVEIAAVQCKGKFLWWQLDAAACGRPHLSLWSTLGMTGRWERRPTAHARLRLCTLGAGGSVGSLWFNDQRNFGTVRVSTDAAELSKKLRSLGPDWLNAEQSPLSKERFLAIAERQCANQRGAAVPLAKFLIDQKKTAGVGNYLLSEALHRAAVWPWAACGDLSPEQWEALYEATSHVTVASYAAQAAGKTPISGGLSELEAHGFTLAVYRRDRTPDGHAVRRDVGPHGRSVHWAPDVQRRPDPERLRS